MQNAWIQNTKAETDQWDWEISDRTYGHITQYAGTDRYCWQAVFFRQLQFQPTRGACKDAGITCRRASCKEQ